MSCDVAGGSGGGSGGGGGDGEGIKRVGGCGGGTDGGAGRVGKKKAVSRSIKAGLVFPVGRIGTKLKKGGYSARVSERAVVSMTAAIEFLVAQVLELAGESAKTHKKKRINPRQIMLGVMNDPEFSQTLRNVHISEGGVIPYVNQFLLRGRGRRGRRGGRGRAAGGEFGEVGQGADGEELGEDGGGQDAEVGQEGDGVAEEDDGEVGQGVDVEEGGGDGPDGGIEEWEVGQGGDGVAEGDDGGGADGEVDQGADGEVGQGGDGIAEGDDGGGADGEVGQGADGEVGHGGDGEVGQGADGGIEGGQGGGVLTIVQLDRLTHMIQLEETCKKIEEGRQIMEGYMSQRQSFVDKMNSFDYLVVNSTDHLKLAIENLSLRNVLITPGTEEPDIAVKANEMLFDILTAEKAAGIDAAAEQGGGGGHGDGGDQGGGGEGGICGRREDGGVDTAGKKSPKKPTKKTPKKATRTSSRIKALNQQN